MTIEQFLELLNQDLCGEFQAIATYTAYASSVVGLNRPELSEMFTDEAHEELEHAQYFSDRIAALGGAPNISLTPIAATDDPAEMIAILRDMEDQTIANYTERADQAKALGLRAISVDIEDILTDELKHYDELNMMLR